VAFSNYVYCIFLLRSLLFYHCHFDLLVLPSFPTRRSSDLRLSNASSAFLASATIGISVDTFFPISAGSMSMCATFDIDPAEIGRSEEHTSELQSRFVFVCRLLLVKKIFCKFYQAN